jgi:hypothetical protein
MSETSLLWSLIAAGVIVVVPLWQVMNDMRRTLHRIEILLQEAAREADRIIKSRGT